MAQNPNLEGGAAITNQGVGEVRLRLMKGHEY